MTVLLGQMTVPPWESHLQRLDGGTVGHGPADDRPVEDIAGELACAMPEPDEGDGSSPPDTDEELRPFTETVTAAGAANGTAGGSAASASTSPTRAPCPAVASPDLPRRSRPGPRPPTGPRDRDSNRLRPVSVPTAESDAGLPGGG